MEETPNTLHTETAQSAEKPLQSDSFSQKVSIFKREATKSLNMKKIFKGVLCISSWIAIACGGLMALLGELEYWTIILVALACVICYISLYNKFLRGIFGGALCITLWLVIIWCGFAALVSFLKGEDPICFVILAFTCWLGSIPLYNKYIKNKFK
jgi:hypothetical protein